MRNGQRIGAVIPALDEEQAIARVIADIPDWVDEIVVADNGSRDGTAEAAREAGARVVHERERGYGAACQAGIRALWRQTLSCSLTATIATIRRKCRQSSIPSPPARWISLSARASRAKPDAGR